MEDLDKVMKKNKIFTFCFIKWLFAICFMLSFIVINDTNVSAEETEIDTGVFEYQENEDGTITITGYNGAGETVIIPSEIDGKKVVDLSESIFDYNQKINSVSLPEGITNIPDRSFSRCWQLETINIPSTVQSIGKSAFDNCINLKSINIPKNLLSIEDNAFSDCQNLKNINLPESLIRIGENCFGGCISFKKITIPRNVKNINQYAFYHCDNLQEVIITSGVTRIENRAFMGCNNLKKIVVPDSINYIDETSFIALYDTYYEDFSINLTTYANPNSYARKYANQKGIKFSCLNSHDWDNGTITLEPTVKCNGEKLFVCTVCGIKRSETLPLASIPKKGKYISVFNSQDIYKVTKSGTEKGTVEFTKTSNIGIVIIPIPNTVTIGGITYKVTSVSKNAFKNNKKLKEVTIGKNVTKINANAFSGCKNLKTISIKSKIVKTVGKNIFKDIHPKAKIKVPSKKLKKYKILLKNKGQKPTVKIIR